MTDQKPPSAPPCWGRQYDEADKECMTQCEYRLTCKPAFFRNHNTPGVSLPMYQPPPSLPSFQQPTWQQPQQQVQQPMRLGVPQTPTYQPLPSPPNPMAPFAPQSNLPQVTGPIAVGQSPHSPYFHQYYSQYSGETVLERLVKHMLLRLGQVLFHELASFLGLWKWPPK